MISYAKRIIMIPEVIVTLLYLSHLVLTSYIFAKYTHLYEKKRIILTLTFGIVMLPHFLLEAKVNRFQFSNAFAIYFATVLARDNTTQEMDKSFSNKGLFEKIKKEIKQLLFFNIQDSIVQKPTSPRVQSKFLHVLKICTLWFLQDTAVFLANECDLGNDSGDSVLVLYWHSVLAGIAVFFALEIIYMMGTLYLSFFDCELPSSLMHTHPLLSTSLREFWSLRWNPIICKLFKDGIYLPLRKKEFPSFVCMIAAFGGSAILHCLPVLIGAYPQFEFSKNICLFFMLHGFFVYISRYFVRLNDEEKGHANIIKKLDLSTYCWVAEFTMCGAVICGLYSLLLQHHHEEFDTTIIQMLIIAAASLFFMSCGIMYYVIIPANYSATSNGFRISLLVQWISTIFVLLATIPLFSVPIVSMFDEVYSKSIMAGKVYFVFAHVLSI